MRAETLFANVYDELSQAVRGGNDHQMLILSRPLRQLLLTNHPLMHQANARIRLKLTFSVNNISIHDAPPFLHRPGSVHIMEAGIDPISTPIKSGSIELTREQFLQREVIAIGDEFFSVRDLIDLAANKLGGVHLDEKLDAKTARLASLGEQVRITEMHPALRLLRAIGRVVLRGLAPLRDAVQTRGTCNPV